MEGFLMKRGKEDSRYHPRKFVLSEADDTLKYHVKEVCVLNCDSCKLCPSDHTAKHTELIKTFRMRMQHYILEFIYTDNLFKNDVNSI
jgi:hypothetical protein